MRDLGGRSRGRGLQRGGTISEGGAEAVFELEVAAGIGGRDDARAGGEDVADLPLLEPAGGFGLGDVVDARAAAAPLGLGTLTEFDAGDRTQDGARLGGDFLSVAEVAAFVVGDGGRRGRNRRTLNV